MPAAVSTIIAVLRSPTLRRLVGAFLAFSVTEWGSWLTIVVYAYGRGGPAEAGVVGCVVFLPSVLVAPAASYFGDRRPRAQVLVAAYAFQAAAMAATAVALIAAPELVVYAFATLASTSITLARPAHAALLPEVVATPDELAIANAASGTVEGLGALLGPLLVGVLVGVGGPPAVYAALAVLTLAASLSVLPIARALRAVDRPSADLAAATLVHELGAGLRTVVGDRRLLAVFAILSGSIALLGAFNVLVTVIAIELLGGSPSTIGYVSAVAGVGSVAGAAATGLLLGRERLAMAYAAAAFLFAGAVVVIGLQPWPVAIVACVVAAGAGWAFVYVEALTLAQRLAGDDVMSRVFGVMESVMMASQSLGALAVSVVVAVGGARAAILAGGVALALVAAAAAPILIRADRITPALERSLRAVRAVTMFGPLSAPVLDRLAAAATTVRFGTGESIVTEGEPGDAFYVILEGAVEVSARGRVLRRQRAGESFGEIALLRDVPRTATVTSLEPTEVLAISRSSFLAAITGQPRSRALAESVTADRLGPAPQVSVVTE